MTIDLQSILGLPDKATKIHNIFCNPQLNV